MSKRKIMFVMNSLYGGGAEKVFQTLINNLSVDKYDIDIISVNQNIIDKNIYKRKFNYSYIFSSGNGLISKIKNKIKLLIYYHTSPSLFYKLFIRKKYDVEVAFIEGYATRILSGSNNKKSKKYVWVHTDMITNHWTDVAYRNNEEEVECYKLVDNIFCVSNEVKKSFISKYKNDKCKVQYNPIDEKEILLKANSETIKKHSSLQLVTIGRLVEEKGYDRLLKVINELKNSYEDFNVWILGDGIDMEEYKEYIQEHKLESYVSLKGFISNPYPFLKCADAFICSSRSEGFSTVATEALILEKPIFTVKCAGMEELFDNYKCGEIVENTDLDLYKLLEKVLINKDNLAVYYSDLKERKSFFTLENRIKEVEAILDEC